MKNSSKIMHFLFRESCNRWLDLPLLGLIMGLLPAIGHADATPNLDPIPDYYQAPGLSPNREYLHQSPGEHIDPFNGKLQFHMVDLYMPGNGGLDIKVQRSYNSTDGFLREPSPFGVGWTMSFGRVLRNASVPMCTLPGATTNKNPILELPDGSREILYAADTVLFPFANTSGSHTFVTKHLWKAECTNSDSVTVYAPDGTQYLMDHIGLAGPSGGAQQAALYVSQITDRNGNTLKFTYQTVNGLYEEVSTITASDGRTVTFNYTGNALDNIKVGNQVIASYTTQPVTGAGPGYFFLKSVSYTDGGTWKYYYNDTLDASQPGALSIKSVTYPASGTYNYTYQLVQFSPLQPTPQKSHAILTKSGDGNTWTYTFTPATTGIATNGTTFLINDCGDPSLDLTTVTSSVDGTTRYCHIGYASSINLVYGIYYATGNLIWVQRGYSNGTAMETEAYSTSPMLITKSQQEYNPINGSATNIATAVIGSHDIARDGQHYTTVFNNYDKYGNPQSIDEYGTTDPAHSTINAGSTNSRHTIYTYIEDANMWVLHLRENERSTINGLDFPYTYREFDSTYNLKFESRLGTTTNWTYTTQGDIKTKTDPRGHISTYSDYYRGVPRSETHPVSSNSADDVSISRTVDNFGNVTSITDGEHVTTSYKYDLLNRITNITHPMGNPVGIVWTTNNRVLTRGSFVETLTFDGFGRTIRIDAQDTSQTPATTISSTKQYDALSRLVYAAYPSYTTAVSGVNPAPAMIGTKTIYDALGRAQSTYLGCASYSDNVCQASSSIQYGPGRKTVTDERGYKSQYFYQAFGDPDQSAVIAIKTPDASANSIIQRNGLGQVTAISQGGLTRSYHYDGYTYFMDSATNPETGTTKYGRDEVGNMTSKQVGSSAATNYTYDYLNRLSTITYPAGTPSVTRTYYKDNLIKTIDNTASQRNYVYDANKNLTSESLVIVAANKTYTSTYAYNQNDALKTLTYASGKVVSYSPDAFGRATQVSPYITSAKYYPNGMLKNIAYANGMTNQLGQDPARLWPNKSVVSNNTLSILNSDIGYDKAGNILSISDAIDPTLNRSMVYDPLERMSSVQGPWGFGTFTYDGNGNILTQKLGMQSLTYQYSASTGQLSSVSGSKPYSFSYDNYGDVSANGNQSFQYDDAITLKCVNCGQANEVGYLYDGEGTRYASTPKNGTPTYFVTAKSGNLLSESTANQSLKEYVYLAGKQIAIRQVDQTSAAVTTPSSTLSVTATPSTTSTAPGTQVSYQLQVSNSGSQAANSAVLTDTLPAGATFVSGSAGCTATGSVVTCPLSTIAAGGSASVTITATLGQGGTTTNVADVSTTSANSSQASFAISTTGQGSLTATTTGLSVSVNPVLSSQAVTLTATVTGSNPTGSVSFYDGSTVIGMAGNSSLQSGSGTFVWTGSLSGGFRKLTAVYSGDSNNQTSMSQSIVEMVNPLAAALLSNSVQ